MIKIRTVLWIAAFAAVAAFLVTYLVTARTGGIFASGQSSIEAPTLAEQISLGGPFRLVDHTGIERSDADFLGKFMLIYFGYTSCPDVCPMSLNRMSAALNELGSDAEKVAPIFVTVDPERDTVEALNAYLSFDRRLIGLTGSDEALAEIAEAYRIYYQKVEEPGSALGYLMNHTSLFYLMDRDGAFLRPLDDESSPDEIAKIVAGYF